ncbi:hypothetical protein D3C79_1049800 [compost metagenome]
MDRLFVCGQVVLRVMLGQCSFTQHVVGVAEAFCFTTCRVGQGLADGFTGDELLAHQAHGHVHTLANQWFATLADDAVE